MKYFFTLIILGSFLIAPCALGDMTSADYHIYADALGVNGGNVASSSDFTLSDTIGEAGPPGSVSSTSYTINAGFQAMELGELILNISPSTINLGTLSTANVSSASAQATVTTDAATGYTLTISDVSGDTLNPVTGGAVVAGIENYGIAVSGSSAAFHDDEPVIAGQTLAASTGPVSNDQVTLTLKASISNNTVQKAYAQTIGMTAIANF